MAALAAGPDVRAAAPDEAALRMARLSQSYRVNLSVLSLVALFTGAFLVFSVLALSVAKNPVWAAAARSRRLPIPSCHTGWGSVRFFSCVPSTVR